MAVYTDVSDEELDAFIGSYAIGALTSFKGIAEGVENSNFLVITDRALLAILENFQGEVPDVLRAYGAPERISG